MGPTLFVLGFVVMLLATTILVLEFGLRLILLLAWAAAWLVGHRGAALVFKSMLEAREGSRQAQVALQRLWFEAGRRQSRLAF